MKQTENLPEKGFRVVIVTVIKEPRGRMHILSS